MIVLSPERVKFVSAESAGEFMRRCIYCLIPPKSEICKCEKPGKIYEAVYILPYPSKGKKAINLFIIFPDFWIGGGMRQGIENYNNICLEKM